MTRKILIVLSLCVLAACSVASPEPENCPREGGVGGTGGCAQVQTH